jgi:hypothetical protein
MPQVSVQLHHLVLFVLVVFSFNVIVLAYLTGAFSIGSVTEFTSSLISKIGVNRPVRQPPPWQRPDYIKPKERIPENQHALGKRTKAAVQSSSCKLGLWKTSDTVFCKNTATSWTEMTAGSTIGDYDEIWFRPSVQEAALFDVQRKIAVILKKGLAFRGQGRTAEAAIRLAFDTIYLRGGQFILENNINQQQPRLELNGEFIESNVGVSNDEDQQVEAGSNEVGEIEQKLHDTNTECTHFWSKEKEAAFCRLKGKNGVWVELDIPTNVVRFKFRQLYHYPDKGEAALFDESRLIVIVLLRRYGLIGHPSSAEQAIDIAKETDDVFFRGGMWRSDTQYKPMPPKVSTNAREKAKVIVMISSYRDVLCSNTLKEIFQYASNPDRVQVSIVNQANLGDIDCLDDYCKEVGESKCRRSQITQIRLPLDKSRGVMFARFLQQTLIQDEEFCLQIDSHMVFPNDWDRIAIDDWLEADNEMAVMTTYPNRAADRNNQDYSPVRCNTVWGSNVVACGTSAHNIKHKQKTPHLIAFFGAGIAFSKCHANLVVPYDPYMAFMFKGEEYNRSARLWTHGYDLYAPKKNYAYHFYDDDPKPEKYKNTHRDRSFFGGNSDSTLLLKQSENRWQAIFGMIPPNDPSSKSGDKDRIERLRQAHAKSNSMKAALLTDIQYFGLGNKRTLREYQIFSGINLAKHTNLDLCDQIGKMPWIPWDNKDYSVLGKNCPVNGPRNCCKTTLDKVMEKGAFLSKYVGFSNDEWADYVKKSGSVAENGTALLTAPITEKGWSNAEKLCR